MFYCISPASVCDFLNSVPKFQVLGWDLSCPLLLLWLTYSVVSDSFAAALPTRSSPVLVITESLVHSPVPSAKQVLNIYLLNDWMTVVLPFLDIVHVWTNERLSGASAMGVPVLAAQHRSILLILKKYLFIWLYWVLVVACEILFPDQGLNPGPLHWEFGVFITGPLGKSLQWVFK